MKVFLNGQEQRQVTPAGTINYATGAFDVTFPTSYIRGGEIEIDFKLLPTPTIIDRIVAEDDPTHPAAERVREYDEMIQNHTIQWKRIKVEPPE
jgi:hypothetical protein